MLKCVCAGASIHFSDLGGGGGGGQKSKKNLKIFGAQSAAAKLKKCVC